MDDEAKQTHVLSPVTRLPWGSVRIGLIGDGFYISAIAPSGTARFDPAARALTVTVRLDTTLLLPPISHSRTLHNYYLLIG